MCSLKAHPVTPFASQHPIALLASLLSPEECQQIRIESQDCWNFKTLLCFIFWVEATKPMTFLLICGCSKGFDTRIFYKSEGHMLCCPSLYWADLEGQWKSFHFGYLMLWCWCSLAILFLLDIAELTCSMKGFLYMQLDKRTWESWCKY